MKIYIAASSNELDRAEYWMNLCESAGISITYNWVLAIKAAGTTNAGLTHADRLKYSGADLRGVWAADIFWLLYPEGPPSFGAAFEAGYAARCAETADRLCVASGTTGHSIFLSRLVERATDVEAFAFIQEYASSKA